MCGKVIPLLEKKCHILCCADNDQRKWDSSFGKYNVKSPEIINDCDCDIIIAVSNKYYTAACANGSQQRSDISLPSELDGS